jgi:hypothetical protein
MKKNEAQKILDDALANGAIVWSDDRMVRFLDGAITGFMERVFNMKRHSYRISDQSSLGDFVGINGLETMGDIQRKIQEVYGRDIYVYQKLHEVVWEAVGGTELPEDAPELSIFPDRKTEN